MNVLHVINTLSAGGAELHLLALCQGLRQRGVEVSIACLKEQVADSRSLRGDFEDLGLRVAVLAGAGNWDVRAVTGAIRVARDASPDIVHTHLPRADLVGALAAALSSSLHVCSVHDIYDGSWSGKWSLPIIRTAWRHADHVIAISAPVRDWVVKRHGVAAAQLTVVPYGIDASMYKPANRRPSECGQPVIGVAGRLEWRKGHDVLIRAMPVLHRMGVGARLVIAGHDPFGYGATLRALISELGLGDCVRLVGFQRDMVAFHAGADVFAFASRSEGFGQVVIEAMAAGKPIVASRIAPLSEIVVEGETGLLPAPDVPEAFAVALAWMLTRPEEAAEMGRRGRERVLSRFTVDRMVEETVGVYQRVLVAGAA